MINEKMEKGKIYKKEPVAATLKQGDYWWCACGHSANQPYCDGTHKTTDETELKSLQFTVDQEKEVYLCQCKQTNTPPYCDGSHNNC